MEGGVNFFWGGGVQKEGSEFFQGYKGGAEFFSAYISKKMVTPNQIPEMSTQSKSIGATIIIMFKCMSRGELYN